jgi:hypothetical protein
MVDDLTSDDEKLLFTREELASDIALILKGDAHSPEALAHLFIILREAIAGGLEGINRTSATLAAAVELTFTHSCAHAAALKLYRLSVEGQLKVEDEPVRLLRAAVERGAAKAGASRTRRGRR